MPGPGRGYLAVGRPRRPGLDAIIASRGRSRTIASDKGTELASMAVLKWCQQSGVEWHYIAPGMRCRTASSRVSTAGRFRDECLNETLFSTLTQARAAIDLWKEDYNQNRPHSALGNITPIEFAIKMALEEQAA